MYRLLSIIATLSLASAIPLPQYELASISDIDFSEPWETTAIDTANANTYLPNSPIILSEVPPTLPNWGWSNRGKDSSWNGKDREPYNGDRSGLGPIPHGQGSDRQGHPRIQGPVATPDQDGGQAPPRLQEDAGVAGAATAVIKGIIDHAPGLNPSPAGGY